MLMGIVILLMVAIIGLFIKMNQLQREVLGALAPLQTGATAANTGLGIGTSAPSFALPDNDGVMVSLEDFVGHKVLLAFSSIGCPHCTEMYPGLKTFSEGANEIQVLMISEGSAEEKRQLVEAQGFAFPVLARDDGVAQNYQVPGTPFFYVIDGEGMIVNIQMRGSDVQR
jgi:methylamine dehydrogenase accessory protein MauD